MLNRFCPRALLCLSLVLPFLVGCTSSQVDTITVTPGTESLAAGRAAQFTATATVGHAGHAPQNVTNTVTWSSSDSTVATVTSSGMATAVAAGTATITASTGGYGGSVSGTATLTVTGGGGGSVSSNFASILIVPSTQIVASLQETGQFIALGVSSDGSEQDITDQVIWTSSDVKVATVDSSGLATGINAGQSTIVALAKNPDGTALTGTAVFTESASGSGTKLATLTVYKVGTTASSGVVTAPDPNTGQANVINCGSGTGCTGNFPIGSVVTLTATPASGGVFAGWSSNCTPTSLPIVPNGPNTCTVTLNDNDTVGAIFD